MKTIGLIGGTSWVSTVEYYKLLNQLTTKRLGGINTAKILLYSLNLSEFKAVLDTGNVLLLEQMLAEVALKLEAAGADCILLCGSTQHLAANEVQKRINIPIIHIAEVTAIEIEKKKISKVALLGTRFTMEDFFFKDPLSRCGIETLIPDYDDREYIHTGIFTELAKGIFREETKKRFLLIIDDLIDKGAEGVIFGCTEIPMFISQADCSIPTFDTTFIHASAAVNFAIADVEVLSYV